MIVSSLTGFAWGVGFAVLLCVIGSVFNSVRSLGDDL